MTSSRLGKGLKRGGELFKRTEVENEQHDSKPNKPMQEEEKKGNERIVQEHFVFTEQLSERLRRYCFEKREKKTWVARKALDEYLKKEGY
jgi:hypothetical protein